MFNEALTSPFMVDAVIGRIDRAFLSIVREGERTCCRKVRAPLCTERIQRTTTMAMPSSSVRYSDRTARHERGSNQPLGQCTKKSGCKAILVIIINGAFLFLLYFLSLSLSLSAFAILAKTTSAGSDGPAGGCSLGT